MADSSISNQCRSSEATSPQNSLKSVLPWLILTSRGRRLLNKWGEMWGEDMPRASTTSHWDWRDLAHLIFKKSHEGSNTFSAMSSDGPLLCCSSGDRDSSCSWNP